METRIMNKNETLLFTDLVARSRTWAGEHQVEAGLAEMAAGATLLALGVKTGAIEMGADLCAHAIGQDGHLPEVLAGTGVGAGAIAGAVVGSIGVVGMGGAIAVPALLLGAGSAAILGGSMYGAGRIIEDLLRPNFDPVVFAGGGCLAVVGAALLLDGARRVLKDPRVLDALSSFKDGILELYEVSKAKVELLLASTCWRVNPTVGRNAASVVAGGIAGTVVGSSVATASVTVLGSQALGGAALSVGLVAAPLLPVIAGAAVGASLFYAGWKGLKHLRC